MLAWIRDLLRLRRTEDDIPPPPPSFEGLSDTERDEHRQTIVEREATLRMLEAKARVKGKG